MIQVLGVKRILVLVLMMAVNAGLAAVVYMYLVPEKAKKESELKTLEGKISSVRSDISRLQLEFDQLEKQQEEFDVLKQKGFFSEQGRNQAKALFDDIQLKSKVISAIANVQSGELQENEETLKANYVLLVSPVKISIEALQDIDVFRYIYLVEQSFPGHMSLQNINLQRKSEITSTVLRSISAGNNPKLVTAELDYLWITMIPKPDNDG